jgi:protease YdgD
MTSFANSIFKYPRPWVSRSVLSAYWKHCNNSVIVWVINCLMIFSYATDAQAEKPTLNPKPGIIGQDDRKPLDTTAWPWQALGRINQADGSHCTGALIAADAVLTAAHCLMNRRSGEWLNPEDVVFVAGFRRDQDLGFARGREILHSAHDINPRRPVIGDIGDDWAVLYLDHALALRPIPIQVLPAGQHPAARLMLAGYSHERPYMLSLQDGCGVVERVDGDRVLLTDCDSTHGDSGSPLLIKKGKNIWIVGVASAIIVRGAGVGSYAVSASSFVGQTAGVK